MFGHRRQTTGPESRHCCQAAWWRRQRPGGRRAELLRSMSAAAR